MRDGRFAIDPEGEYPSIPRSRWTGPLRRFLNQDGKVVNELGGFLIRTRDRVVLVDAGVGCTRIPGWRTGRLLASLARLGVAPEDVTDVAFTHLHFDHVGWASWDGSPTFPRATYRCHEHDWAYFTNDYKPRPSEVARFPPEVLPPRRLAPVADRVETWSGRGSLLPGVDALETPGHTPGHTAFVISSGRQRAMLIGDVAHCQVELLEDDWDGVADVDARRARETAGELARLLARDGTVFAAAHFRDFAWGRLVRRAGRLDWTAA